MQIEKTNIDGVSIIRVDKFPDERGMFMELYSEEKYLAHQLMGKSIQINFSHSEKSVLRGLHYQIEQQYVGLPQFLLTYQDLYQSDLDQ